jgi:ectoine hydroxylase-related dioxygenase (phytanoyl-CoA dioxygenase family)
VYRLIGRQGQRLPDGPGEEIAIVKVLTAEQRRQFEEDGCVVVENVLDPSLDIAPVMAEYSRVLDRMAESLVAEGAIQSTYAELPFADRLIQVYTESGRNFPKEFDISLPLANVKADSPIHLGPAVFGLMTSPRLLDAVEDVIGPEIFSNPVQHIRMKVLKSAIAPGFESNGGVAQVGWHQDNGVVLEEADEATILTVWIPLNEATVENGCLRVFPRSHRDDLLAHCPTSNGMRIPDQLLPENAPRNLPMPAGSVLLMHQKTVHSSLDNQTPDQVRLSFDLRYQPTGQPTGRPSFPGFVARSASDPSSELRDPSVWARLWLDARDHLSEADGPRLSRWDGDSPVCA